MQAGDYTIMLKAKDEDTVRIRLDFIQFTVTIHICRQISTSMDRYKSFFQFPRDVVTAPAPATRVEDCRQNQMTISRLDAMDENVVTYKYVYFLKAQCSGQHW